MATTPETRNDNSRIWAGVAVLAIVCATAIGVFAVVPHAANPGFVLTQILSFGGLALAAIRGQYSTDKARTEVDAANGKLDRVLNGEMDKKIERAVHKVLSEREPLPVVPADPESGGVAFLEQTPEGRSDFTEPTGGPR